jgi:hypothetical protein
MTRGWPRDVTQKASVLLDAMNLPDHAFRSCGDVINP